MAREILSFRDWLEMELEDSEFEKFFNQARSEFEKRENEQSDERNAKDG